MKNRRWIYRDQQDIEKAEDLQSAGISSKGLPPSKRYKVDPQYSREPKAFCGNVKKLGLPPCRYGEGTYCYSRKVCESQLSLDNPDEYTDGAKKKASMEEQRALEHAREISSQMRDERSMSDEEYSSLVNKIMEGL